MVRIKRPKAAVTPEMFIIGGKEVDAIYISKYPNKVIDGRAYSLPMVDPTTEITFDEALEACTTKGEGWHLMTATEWEYLLNESRELGTMPHGNTDWGSDYYRKKGTEIMADKIKCAGCEHCKGFRKMSNTRAEFSCEHPNQSYIIDYFKDHNIKKMPGFLAFGKPYASEVPVKTSPTWCPKKAGGKNR